MSKNKPLRKMPDKKTRATATPPRRAGAREEFRFVVGQSSLGPILAAFSERGIVSVIVRQDAALLVSDLHQRFPKAKLTPGNKHDKAILTSIVDLVDNPAPAHNLPLDMRGTVFQRRVWREVCKIPLGQTSNYSEIAQKIGAVRAMRAVGTSCTASHFAIIVPCHRVLHKDGSLSGSTARSNARQRALLDKESAAAKKLAAKK